MSSHHGLKKTGLHQRAGVFAAFNKAQRVSSAALLHWRQDLLPMTVNAGAVMVSVALVAVAVTSTSVES